MEEKQIPLVIVTESLDNEFKTILNKYSALPASIIEAHLKALLAEVAQFKVREISQAYAEMAKEEKDDADRKPVD